ncbi:MAG: CvpA family protein [Firmicutes bacterium]|nr:CvpA family protein [Bacillota bacterium]
MILDIITAALIVVPMGIGMAKGVAYIAARALGWIGSLVGAFLLNPLVTKWLTASPIGNTVYDSLEDKFGGPAQSVNSATEGLPQIISGGINAAVQDATDQMVQIVGGFILSVMAFLVVVLVVRVLAGILIRVTSRRRGSSGRIPVISRLNKFGGLLVGGVEGLLLAFLFLAALIPIMNMASPETAESIADGLRYSYLAGPLYDGNFLLVMTTFR